MFKALILSFSLFAAIATIPTAKAEANTGYTFEWSNGFDGYGHCYQVTLDGQLLNGGNPVDDSYCERVQRSYFIWSVDFNGYGVCLRRTPNGYLLDGGRAQSENLCERSQASHYTWSNGFNGYTHCYHVTPDGKLLNGGNPVDNWYCH